jgi:hypothetical protein
MSLGNLIMKDQNELWLFENNRNNISGCNREV